MLGCMRFVIILLVFLFRMNEPLKNTLGCNPKKIKVTA